VSYCLFGSFARRLILHNRLSYNTTAERPEMRHNVSTDCTSPHSPTQQPTHLVYFSPPPTTRTSIFQPRMTTLGLSNRLSPTDSRSILYSLAVSRCIAAEAGANDLVAKLGMPQGKQLHFCTVVVLYSICICGPVFIIYEQNTLALLLLASGWL
jgi:hypothetical protein